MPRHRIAIAASARAKPRELVVHADDARVVGAAARAFDRAALPFQIDPDVARWWGSIRHRADGAPIDADRHDVRQTYSCRRPQEVRDARSRGR